MEIIQRRSFCCRNNFYPRQLTTLTSSLLMKAPWQSKNNIQRNASDICSISNKICVKRPNILNNNMPVGSHLIDGTVEISCSRTSEKMNNIPRRLPYKANNLSILKTCLNNMRCTVLYSGVQHHHDYHTSPADHQQRPVPMRLRPVNEIFQLVTEGNRSALASAITAVESLNKRKDDRSEQLVQLAMDHKKYSDVKSFRLGFTGSPGAGKSTLIETLGKKLTGMGHKIAVLAVDPSSAKTGGSLLGDRTRMTELSRDPNAFIRPSPAGGTLGGVTRSTNEAIVLCEAAGYDIIIVETVGVGQSEHIISNMVDMFILIVPPAAGDELQGIKKGIVEMADLILVNKADGDLLPAATKIQTEYSSALRLLRHSNTVWRPRVAAVSSLKDEGFDKAWRLVSKYRTAMDDAGLLEQKRTEQYKTWMWQYIRDNIMGTFISDPNVKNKLKQMENDVEKGEIAPFLAADQLLRIFGNGKR